MVANVLELRASPAGWYLPPLPSLFAPAPIMRPPQAARRDEPLEELEAVALDYGPDGRLRSPSPRPRFSFQA